MTSKRLYLVLMAVIGLLCIGLIGGAYNANSLLTKQAGKLTALKAKSQALDQERVSLVKAKKDIQKYADLERIAKSVVPQDKNQALAVREIVNIAATNKIKLSAITFPASTLGAGLKTSGATAAPAPTASASPKTGALSQLQAVKTIPGVYLLQINVTSDPKQTVLYNQFIDFLSSLEHNRRTAQVSTITLQPDPNNHSNLSFTLTINEYIKP